MRNLTSLYLNKLPFPVPGLLELHRRVIRHSRNESQILSRDTGRRKYPPRA